MALPGNHAADGLTNPEIGHGGAVNTPRSPRRIGYLLAVVLLTAAACTAGETGSPDPTTTVPTTDPTVQSTAPDDPASTTTTSEPTTSSSGGGSSTTIAPSTSTTTTSTTTTTTTLPPLEPTTFDSLRGIHTITDFAGFTSRGVTRWQQSVPGIEDIRITSTADGAEQPALWLAPRGDRDRPLLVILHSWSAPYLQHAGIPYAMWAQENGWAVIAPNFRGVNDDAEATGSDLAVQDVVDAIDYAVSRDGVEEDRVYAVGYSGGGMMSLLMAGRHPDLVTAVAAWGPPYDLVEFYGESAATGRHYAGDLWRACGGDPTESGPAQEECQRRSPMAHLDAAREHGVPIYIGQGLYDSLLSPAHGARAFNQLADPADHLGPAQIDELERGRIPGGIAEPITTDPFFGEGDPAPLFARRSASVWLVFFQADHDMVYQATLRWFSTDPRPSG